MAREQCGVFAVCFRHVFRLFSGRLRVSRNGTVFQWDSKRTDRNENRPPASFGTPEGSYPFRSRDRLRMGPIRATFLNPRRRPSRTVPVKLPPSPDTRHFSMGPILGLRSLPTTGSRAKVRSDSNTVSGRARFWGVTQSVSLALEGSAPLGILPVAGRRDRLQAVRQADCAGVGVAATTDAARTGPPWSRCTCPYRHLRWQSTSKNCSEERWSRKSRELYLFCNVRLPWP